MHPNSIISQFPILGGTVQGQIPFSSPKEYHGKSGQQQKRPSPGDGTSSSCKSHRLTAPLQLRQALELGAALAFLLCFEDCRVRTGLFQTCAP